MREVSILSTKCKRHEVESVGHNNIRQTIAVEIARCSKVSLRTNHRLRSEVAPSISEKVQHVRRGNCSVHSGKIGEPVVIEVSHNKVIELRPWCPNRGACHLRERAVAIATERIERYRAFHRLYDQIRNAVQVEVDHIRKAVYSIQTRNRLVLKVP